MLSIFCTDPLLPMSPQNWVHLLVGVEPKDITKPKIRRGKDLLLAASKENTGPNQCLPKQQNWGSFNLRAYV